ncbi:MAG: YIP1 family protein, partial [Vicinamibacterales bacterium]|nr:YIP1 family protein [Vicinamibacterales bacterium]
FTALFAGLLFGVFSGALGGQASFKQVFAVLAHTSVLSLLQALFVTPMNYARESLSSATSLGVFLPMLPEGSFLANFLGAIDLFILWSLALTAIGLAVLYRRKTAPIFISLVAAYAVIALAIAAVKAALGGS